MKKITLIIILILSICSLSYLVNPRKLEVKIFTSETCGACKILKNEVMPAIEKKYHNKVKFEYIDVKKNRLLFQFINEQGAPKYTTPTAIIGKHTLVGLGQIKTFIDIIIRRELTK